MLLEVLEKQKKLDSWLGKGKRERNITDICMSAIAECIELNEEFVDEFRFKTWKPKKYNDTNRNKELIDIFFFISQLINKSVDINKNEIFIMNLEDVLKESCKLKNIDLDINPNKELSKLISVFSNLSYICSISKKNEAYLNSCVIEDLTSVLRIYGNLSSKLGIDYITLKELYNDKMEVNLNREDFKKAVGGFINENK